MQFPETVVQISAARALSFNTASKYGSNTFHLHLEEAADDSQVTIFWPPPTPRLLAILLRGEQRFHRSRMQPLLLLRRLLFDTIQADLHLPLPWQKKRLASGHIYFQSALQEEQQCIPNSLSQEEVPMTVKESIRMR